MLAFHKSGERTCFYCGQADIAAGLHVDQTADAGQIGLAYKAWKVLEGTERFYADLCRSCGTVLRLYVKEPKRNWVQDKDSPESDSRSLQAK